jgi:hypothetical protein
MNKDEFRNLVKTVILEVKQEKSKEPDYMKRKDKKSYLNGEKSKYQRNVDNKVDKTAHALLDKIVNVVKGIDTNIEAILDDHNDISVRLPGVFRIRIRPNWSNNYTVEAFRNMSDRVYAVGLDGKQVLNFIRVNFVANKKGYVQSAYDKVVDQMKDKTEKKAGELPKTEKVPNKEVPEKDKEDLSKDEDHDQSAPMSVAEEPERQEDHGVEKAKNMSKAVAMSKKDVDDSLTIKKSEFGDTSKIGKKV